VTHIIQGARVFLRPLEAADAELYRRWRADALPMALAGWRDPAPLSLAQVEARIARLAKEQGDDIYNFLICLAADGRAIGEIALADVDRRNGSAEVGIFIGEPEEWGKGYGTEAVRALVDFGFGELRLERIWLEVWTENGRARRAYEKAGFVHEGTIRNDRYEFGRLTSGDIMSILRDEWLAPPQPGG
jgi:RimJ/RimL family protein N-acetyltransferase